MSKIYGLKEVKLITLREDSGFDLIVDTPEKMGPIFSKIQLEHPYFDPNRESFFVFFVNTRRRITGWQLVAHGILDTIIIHPREVFKSAIVASAAAIIIAHNHPSGECSPSDADVAMTRQLIQAGNLLKIEVLDHIIFHEEKQQSLRSLGYFYS